MSKIRTMLVATVTAAVSTVGLVATSAPQAQAADPCAGGPNVYCSMQYARKVTEPQRVIYGARNTPIANTQAALTEVGFPVGATGHFNTYTVAALKKYQYSRKLTVSGRLDSSTLRALQVGAGNKRAVPATKQTIAVNYAQQQIGKPYRYGATGPSAYDCSGLVFASYKKAGITLPRTSHAQLSKYRTVSKSSLKPGDIVGYNGGGHVGIYVGNGQIVHSSRPGVPVKKVPLNYMRYYKAVRPIS